MEFKNIKKLISIKLDPETQMMYDYLKSRINVSQLVREAIKAEYEKRKIIVDK